MAEMRGLKELLQNLAELDRSMKTEARAMANAGAQVVKKEAITIAKAHGLVDTGALTKNIAVKRETGTPSNIFEYHVGVRHGGEAKSAERIAVKGADGKLRYEWTNNPFYWWFWELGHFNTWTHSFVPAKPFIGPALANKKEEAFEAMRKRGADRLEKFTQKARA